MRGIELGIVGFGESSGGGGSVSSGWRGDGHERERELVEDYGDSMTTDVACSDLRRFCYGRKEQNRTEMEKSRRRLLPPKTGKMKLKKKHF